MAEAEAKGKGREGEIVTTRPRWSILPPEIIRMILQYLATDKETLHACSRAARDFRHVALSFLGRHLAVKTVVRLRGCTRMIRRGAFQHVRSLDLGVGDKDVILEEYWKGYITILGSFARYRALNRLWLTEVPFTFLQKSQKKKLRETITILGTTVTELGLYECHFSSPEEMISLIRSFPLCSSLFVRNCIVGEQATGGNAFAGIPEHRLTVKDLQLSAPSSSDSLIDIPNLIEAAALDVGSLTSLFCDVGNSERTRRVAAAVSLSPVEQFQVACTRPRGFQEFIGHLSTWKLTSLTIGPQTQETDAEFWVEAFNGIPQLSRVEKVTVIYHYPTLEAFNIDCWEYFSHTLSRKDLFPSLRSVHIQLGYSDEWAPVSYRRTIKDTRSVYVRADSDQ